MPAPSIILRTQGLPVAALSLLFLGAFSTSYQPFQSRISIGKIGLSEQGFALVPMLASAVAVTASVLLDILSDKLANRWLMSILTFATGTAGLGLMLMAPGKAAFIFCHGRRCAPACPAPSLRRYWSGTGFCTTVAP